MPVKLLLIFLPHVKIFLYVHNKLILSIKDWRSGNHEFSRFLNLFSWLGSIAVSIVMI